MIWSSVHRFGTMGISFITNLVLARLLTPEDFGILGMIIVFIAVSEVFVDGGFASALIQKKEPTDEDYSTIFYWNLFVSIILFLGFYIAAPSIEKFYNMPELSSILRVLSVSLILNAFNIIQSNKLVKSLNFKKLANIHLSANILGAITAVVMATWGFGVWSLVAKTLIVAFIQMIILWFTSSWMPLFVFNFSSFKKLFGFGSYILLTNLLNRIYDNIQLLLIGKLFSAADLGYYTQAKRMEEVPVKSLSSVVNQVTFPVFSELQDDIEKLKKGISNSLKAITYVNFPIMVFIVIAAKPIIIMLLSDKWSESIPYLQLLGVVGMLYTLNTANTNIFKSLGRSDTYFWITLSKRLIGIGFIIMGAKYGIIGMLYAMIMNTYLFFIVNAYYSSRLTGYTIWNQITDVFPAYFVSIIAGLITYILTASIGQPLFMFAAECIIFILIYIAVSYLLKLESFNIYLDIIKSKFKK